MAQFKKGVSGNPNGRPKVPDELKKARLQFSKDIEAVIYAYSNHSKDELKAAQKDPKTKALDLMVLGIMLKSLKDGDQQRLGFLLDRTIGKVKERVVTENLNINAGVTVNEVDVKDRIKQLKGESE